MKTSKENLVEIIRQYCKPNFSGSLPRQVEQIKKSGRSIASVSDILSIMRALRDDKTGLRETYLGDLFYNGCGSSFYTGDAAVYHPNGEVKIVLDSEHISGLDSMIRLKACGLFLTELTKFTE